MAKHGLAVDYILDYMKGISYELPTGIIEEAEMLEAFNIVTASKEGYLAGKKNCINDEAYKYSQDYFSKTFQYDKQTTL
jgi:hypothetical protein